VTLSIPSAMTAPGSVTATTYLAGDNVRVTSSRFTRVTVATLPSTPSAGWVAVISDSSSGDCVTGGGSIQAKCIYNGTAWEAF
jgi:hypothetical protein